MTLFKKEKKHFFVKTKHQCLSTDNERHFDLNFTILTNKSHLCDTTRPFIYRPIFHIFNILIIVLPRLELNTN